MMKSSVKLIALNDHIKCKLCDGYLIDATTIIECLHSFCKTCIVKYLETKKCCPSCDTQIHKTKPLLNIRSDPTLQDIVYKIVPGLFKEEMKRRREFYEKNPEAEQNISSAEDRGIISGERMIYSPDDPISISIEYLPEVISYSYLPLSSSKSQATHTETHNQRRYLQCQGGMRVYHLKKWLRSKYELSATHDVEVLYKHDPLCDEYTMMDLAYIYSWRRNGPLSLYYKIIDLNKSTKRRKFDLKYNNEVKKETQSVNEEIMSNANAMKTCNSLSKKKNSKKKLAKVIERLTKGVVFSDSNKANENNPNSVAIKLNEESVISYSTKLDSCTNESAFNNYSSTADWSDLQLMPKIPKVIIEDIDPRSPINVSTHLMQNS